jgi:hypothetical protein
MQTIEMKFFTTYAGYSFFDKREGKNTPVENDVF